MPHIYWKIQMWRSIYIYFTILKKKNHSYGHYHFLTIEWKWILVYVLELHNFVASNGDVIRTVHIMVIIGKGMGRAADGARGAVESTTTSCSKRRKGRKRNQHSKKDFRNTFAKPCHVVCSAIAYQIDNLCDLVCCIDSSCPENCLLWQKYCMSSNGIGHLQKN